MNALGFSGHFIVLHRAVGSVMVRAAQKCRMQKR